MERAGSLSQAFTWLNSNLPNKKVILGTSEKQEHDKPKSGGK